MGVVVVVGSGGSGSGSGGGGSGSGGFDNARVLSRHWVFVAAYRNAVLKNDHIHIIFCCFFSSNIFVLCIVTFSTIDVIR